MWYLIFTKVTVIGDIFFFPDVSVFLSFVSFFLVAVHKKDFFKFRIDQNISAHINDIKGHIYLVQMVLESEFWKKKTVYFYK